MDEYEIEEIREELDVKRGRLQLASLEKQDLEDQLYPVTIEVEDLEHDIHELEQRLDFLLEQKLL